MPKAKSKSHQEEEDNSNSEWETVTRRRQSRDKGCDRKLPPASGRDCDRNPTNQPPEESAVTPSKTTSLGGKRSWASDSDSDGQADPKRTPTCHHDSDLPLHSMPTTSRDREEPLTSSTKHTPGSQLQL